MILTRNPLRWCAALIVLAVSAPLVAPMPCCAASDLAEFVA